MSARTVFHPVEGAVVDLDSLAAVAALEDLLLGALIRARAPGRPSLVLEGLDLADDGKDQSELSFSPGLALLPREDGERALVTVVEPLRVPLKAEDQCVALALEAAGPRTLHAGGAATARGALDARVRVLDARALGPWLRAQRGLMLAAYDGQRGRWIWDLDRLCPPDHALVTHWLRHLAEIERQGWSTREAESAGALVAKDEDYTRIRVVVGGAVLATRAALLAAPSASADRLRLLNHLFVQLSGVWRSLSTEFLNLIPPLWVALLGAREAPDLHRALARPESR